MLASLDAIERKLLEDSLNASLENPALFAVEFSPEGLQLIEKESGGVNQAKAKTAAAAKAITPVAIRVDFLSGALSHRRKFGGGQGQLIARAVGIGAGIRPRVLDATAGLGKDAFVLASLGCSVTLIERVPILAALLKDGLRRAAVVANANTNVNALAEKNADTNENTHENTTIRAVIQRMCLLEGDAILLMRAWSLGDKDVPQTIYLDPMFPGREKSALVKKEMRFFQRFFSYENNGDADESELLATALALASHRVVVKRPRKAPAIVGEPPSYVLEGKSCRFDVYAKKSFKAK